MTSQKIMLAFVASIAIAMMMPSVLADEIDESAINADIEKMNGIISGIQTANYLMDTDIASTVEQNLDRLVAIGVYQEKANSKQALLDSTLSALEELDAIVDDPDASLTAKQEKAYVQLQSQRDQCQVDIDFVEAKIVELVDAIQSDEESIVLAQEQIDVNDTKIGVLNAKIDHLQSLLTNASD